MIPLAFHKREQHWVSGGPFPSSNFAQLFLTYHVLILQSLPFVYLNRTLASSRPAWLSTHPGKATKAVAKGLGGEHLGAAAQQEAAVRVAGQPSQHQFTQPLEKYTPGTLLSPNSSAMRDCSGKAVASRSKEVILLLSSLLVRHAWKTLSSSELPSARVTRS